MKLGILTIIDYRNYGNRLQNFALQTFLEENGFETETIIHDDYYDYKHTKFYYRKKPVHILRSLFWSVYDLIKRKNHDMLYTLLGDSLDKERIYKNINFSKQKIHESEYIIHEGNNWKKKVRDFDGFIVGSDQVWNPSVPGKATDYYFLQFVEEGKRVSFAASVASDSIPEDKLEQWKYYVSGMDFISVREDKACELIRRYTQKEAVRHLDPTMLIGKSIYYSLMAMHETKLPKKYIAIYMLGDFEGVDAENLDKYAKENGCEIVRLNDKRFPEIYTFDVIDFLNCISNAEIVLTDSFHACVFSILFNKVFGVFKRTGQYNEMYSRIEDLLCTFGLEQNQISSLEEMTKIQQVDETKINSILELEHEKACDYLKVIKQVYI